MTHMHQERAVSSAHFAHVPSEGIEVEGSGADQTDA